MISNRAEFFSIFEECIEQSPTITTLKSDVAVLKSDVAVLKSDVAVLKSDVAVLKSDVNKLKTDVTALKIDVARLKTDVAELKSDVADIKSVEQGRHLEDKIQHWGARYEEINHNIKLILEAVLRAKRREETITKLAETSDYH